MDWVSQEVAYENDTKLLTSLSEIKRTENFDASLDVRIKVYRGRASLARARSSEAVTTSVYYAVTARGTLGTKEFKANVSISDNKANESLSSYDTFIDRYGTHYVSKIEKGWHVTLIFQLDSTTAEERESLNASGSISAQSPTAGGKVTASYSQTLSKLNRQGRLRVFTQSAGLEIDAFDLSSLFAAVNNGQDLGNAMNNVIKNLNLAWDTAATTRIWLSSYETLGLSKSNFSLVSEYRNSLLKELVENYRDAVDIRALCGEVLENGNPLGKTLSEAERRNLESVSPIMRDYSLRVGSMHDDALTAKTLEKIEIEPFPKVALSGLFLPEKPIGEMIFSVGEGKELSKADSVAVAEIAKKHSANALQAIWEKFDDQRIWSVACRYRVRGLHLESCNFVVIDRNRLSVVRTLSPLISSGQSSNGNLTYALLRLYEGVTVTDGKPDVYIALESPIYNLMLNDAAERNDASDIAYGFEVKDRYGRTTLLQLALWNSKKVESGDGVSFIVKD